MCSAHLWGQGREPSSGTSTWMLCSQRSEVQCGVPAAAEMVDLRAAVVGIREAFADVSANAAPDQAGVLLLNLKEKRDLLARKIRQLSPSTLSVQVLTPPSHLRCVWCRTRQTCCTRPSSSVHDRMLMRS